MYCESCCRLTDTETCPECGKKLLRPVRENDPCFVLSTGQIWADMVCDVLKQNEIPFLKQGRMGAGLTMLTGIPLETYSLYVPYSHFEQAKEIADALIAAPIVDDSENEQSDLGEEPEEE
ncbi:MAG: hypothetical protein Q4G00_03290 [Clostridia bacterium]|nr:hypothetical protein [Clostridia bacterium]